MKASLTLLLVFFLHSAWATTYYFSTSSGNDSRSSSEAQNPSTPWKTINKLNSFFSSLNPGDAVLFKRGETFYGSITINKSGTSGSPILIGAYGTGNRPVITSLVTLSGWTANSSYKGVYECSANSAFGAAVNVVLLNDVEKGMGRYPNADATNKGYLTLESHGTNTITDNELSSSPNWTGAELVIRPCHWKLDRYKINSHSGHTINYAGNDAQNNYGYFIQNSIKTLDQLGEWYYNPSTKKLSMYFGSNSPSSYTVKASALDYLIYSKSRSYVIFDNLTFKGANQDGIDINSGNNIQIKNCDVLFSGKDGVSLSNHSYFTIENCTVSNSYNNGISAGSSNPHAIVRNNIVKNSYSVAGMGQSGDGQGAGIRINENGLAEYNQITNSGFLGIAMGGNYCVVKNNYIDTFCFVKDDGGGIYAYNASNSVNNTGRKVTGNIILNGIGAHEGTSVTFSSADGLYFDGFINGVEISGNTIANSNRGIYLHNNRDITVTNNTSYNNGWGQLHMKHDASGGFRNQTITNNIFFSKTSDQPVTAVLSRFDNADIKSAGNMDYNFYARPINPSALINATIYLYQSNQKKTMADLPVWKSTYSKDANSKLSEKTFKQYPDDNIKFVYNATKADKTVSLNTTYVDARNQKYSNSITLKPFTSAVLIKDGTVTTGNTAPNVSITSPATNSSFTAPATVNISASASDNDGTVSKVDFYKGSTLIKTETSAPYNCSLGNLPAGTYTLTAKATDNDGAVTTSSSVTVYVGSSTGNKAPSVSLTNPTNNASYSSGSTINMLATATDPDGSISKVEFYSGTKLLHTEYNGTYSYSWSNVPAGTYTITAKATDNKGLTTTSSTAKIYVGTSTGNKAPTVSLSSPTNNASYKTGSTIYMLAKATDADGSISKVEFFSGSKLLHTEYNGTYSYSWSNVPGGTYTITAKATDNKGLSTTSSSVKIYVTSSRSNNNQSSTTINNDSTDLIQKIAGNNASKTINFKLFPNPATDVINLSFDEIQSQQQATLTIQNIGGSILKSYPVVVSGKTLQVDISSLNTGMFIITLKGEGFSTNKSFIKGKTN
ncbi:Ig-like domain-containing protein [Segetibacter koreensis]|uniref:Ig-like domain-containing protein n=1 Tax=Segetibacter koreensis TaxID=398037 RepID=UPI0012FB1D5A|nr:Ig-like domain-containing protein [Segetibacter koreensis]